MYNKVQGIAAMVFGQVAWNMPASSQQYNAAESRKKENRIEIIEKQDSCKYSRLCETAPMEANLFFFCWKINRSLHEVSIVQVEQNICESATFIEDNLNFW